MALFTFSKFHQLKCLSSSKSVTSQLISRWLSTANRPVAILEEQVEENLSKNEISVKKHPGVFNRGVVRLPDELKMAVDRVIADKSADNLVENGRELNNHIIYKKPPLSQEQLNQLKLECQEKVVSSNPIPNTDYLSAKDLKRVTDSLQTKVHKYFKQKAYSWTPVDYDESKAIVYLAARLAPDFASLHSIFNEIAKRDPTFKPETLFDFGSGVGSTLWAAKSSWNPRKIREVFCIDSSIHMNTLARALLQKGVWPRESSFSPEEEAQRGLYFRQFMPTSASIKYDLVVCAHTLLELPSAELRLQTALSLWRKTQGYLVFVEHGSRAAYEVVMEVRDFLLSLSKDGREPSLTGHIFSPCPHDSRCPRMVDWTPCNFMVNYEPILIKQSARLSKEKFSYVVLKKGERPETNPQWPRVVRPVLDRARHTICRLCTSQGKLEEVVITRGKHSLMTNRCARNTEWGDLLPVKLSASSKIEPEEDSLVAEESHSEESHLVNEKSAKTIKDE